MGGHARDIHSVDWCGGDRLLHLGSLPTVVAAAQRAGAARDTGSCCFILQRARAASSGCSGFADLGSTPSLDASPTPSNATLVIADAAPPAVVDAAPPERSAPAKKVVTINTSACDDRQLVPGCDAAFPAKVVCPASMADVPDGALCGLSGKTQAPRACTYREGSCACAHTPYCGGASPTFLQQSGMYWQCKPPRQPGDCPDAASSGQACSVEGKQCASGGCGTSTRCTCTKGRFKCTTAHFAPPP